MILKPDFTRDDLVVVFMRKLMPYVTRYRSGEGSDPLYIAYNRVYKSWLDPELAKGSQMIQEHQEKIFGGGFQAFNEPPPELYNEFDYAKSLNIPYKSWLKMPVQDQAMEIAYMRISSMKEIYKRHVEIVEENKKRAMKNNGD